MAGWHEPNCKGPGEGAKLWLLILVIVALVVATAAAGMRYDEPGRARGAAATATWAAETFAAQLTAMAAEGDCIPMPCPENGEVAR